MKSILTIRLKRKHFIVFDFIGMEDSDTLELVSLACRRGNIPPDYVADFVDGRRSTIQHVTGDFTLSLKRERIN